MRDRQIRANNGRAVPGVRARAVARTNRPLVDARHEFLSPPLENPRSRDANARARDGRLEDLLAATVEADGVVRGSRCRLPGEDAAANCGALTRTTLRL